MIWPRRARRANDHHPSEDRRPEPARPPIRPYVVRSDPRSLESLVTQVNRAQFDTYSADFTVGAGLEKLLLNPLFDYERLLRLLESIPQVQFLTMEELIGGGGREGAVRVTIRHDVDGDIVCAQRMAGLEHAHGISTTYYILHTSYYYGHFDDGVFYRHDCLGPCLRVIQDLGHEIGLHTDGLLVYQTYGLNGAEAVVQELRWLREQGLRVVGSAAHNHHSVYGAQNFEIFRGRVRNYVMPGGNEPPTVDEDEVFFHGKWAPLHRLDEGALGLEYEAHDSYLVPGYLGIMAEIDFGTINQTWNQKQNPRQRGLENGPGDFARLEDAMARLRPGDAVIFTTHPCYYGGRHDPSAAPALRIDHLEPIASDGLGWITYRPGSLVAVSSHEDGGQTGQSIGFANEMGLLAKPLGGDQDLPTILLFGGAQIEGRTLGLPEQVQWRLERRLRDRMGKPVRVRSCAFPGMAVERYAAWCEALATRVRPVVVLAGLDAEALNPEDRPRWADGAGGSGRYLAWDAAAGDVRWQSSGAAGAPGVAPPDSGIDAVTGAAWLTACYRRLAGIVREHGGTLFMLLEGGGGVEADEPRAKRFRDRAGAVAEGAGIPLIDTTAPLRAWSGPGAAVDRHGRWTAVGHRVVADVVAEAILDETGALPGAAILQPAASGGHHR